MGSRQGWSGAAGQSGISSLYRQRTEEPFESTTDEEEEATRQGGFASRRQGIQSGRWSGLRRGFGQQQQRGGLFGGMMGAEEQQQYGFGGRFMGGRGGYGYKQQQQQMQQQLHDVEEVFRDLSIDRERDLFHAKLITKLLNSRAMNRNVHQVLHAMESGEKVPKPEIYQLLAEDVLADAAADDVILEIVEDWKCNRKTDEILNNLQKGRAHTYRTNDEQEEMEDEQKDVRLHKIVKKLIKPNAGARLHKMCGGDWKSVCGARGCHVTVGGTSTGLSGAGAVGSSSRAAVGSSNL